MYVKNVVWIYSGSVYRIFCSEKCFQNWMCFERFFAVLQGVDRFRKW